MSEGKEPLTGISEVDLSALMDALGRTCRYCAYYDPNAEDPNTGVCRGNGIERWADVDSCSVWIRRKEGRQ